MTGGRLRIARLFVICAAMALAGAMPAVAQEAALTEACEGAPAGSAREFCNLIAQAIEIVQPRLGLAGTGGNPVPGTASTLGMRIGTLPRISLGARLTGIWVGIPQVRSRSSTEDLDFLLPSLNADAAVGLFGGFSPAPTVGGMGSVDLLGSIGFIPLPGDDGFQDDWPFTWAFGARLGILRESFTLPGVSLSGMYRRVGDIRFGDPELETSDAFFNTDLSVLSARAAVSKRVLTIGVTLGVGYDHYSSDVAFGIDPGIAATETRLSVEDFENDRYTAFANASWTLLIFHLAGELGWQSGGDRVPADLPADVDVDPGDGAWYGSLAFRVSI